MLDVGVRGSSKFRSAFGRAADNFEAMSRRHALPQGPVVLGFDACKANHVFPVAGASDNEFLAIAKAF